MPASRATQLAADALTLLACALCSSPTSAAVLSLAGGIAVPTSALLVLAVPLGLVSIGLRLQVGFAHLSLFGRLELFLVPRIFLLLGLAVLV